MSGWSEVVVCYQKNVLKQVCDFLGTVIRAIVPGQKGMRVLVNIIAKSVTSILFAEHHFQRVSFVSDQTDGYTSAYVN